MDASGWHDRESEDCVTDAEKADKQAQLQRREELIRLSVAMIRRDRESRMPAAIVRNAYSVLLAIDEILDDESEE